MSTLNNLSNKLSALTLQGMLAVMLIIALAAVPLVPAKLSAQSNTSPPNPVTTLTQTTLSADIGSASATNPQTEVGTSTVTVASATGFVVGYRMFVLTAGLTEAMDVTAISGTTISVTRGAAGTSRRFHASGDTVFVARAALYYVQGPQHACTSATTGTGATAVTTSTTTPTPWVDIQHGDIYYCYGNQWVQTVHNGFSEGFGGGQHVYTYTVAGAIYPAPGLHLVNGTTLAMTIAPPTKDMDGMIMTIMALNASAHTLTYTAGFSQSTTSSDIGTFGGAVNDNITIIARAGVWNVISTRNVTIA